MSENFSKSLLKQRVVWSLLAVASVALAYGVAILASIVLINLFALVGLRLDALNSNVANFVGNLLVWTIMLLVIIVPLKKWNIVKNIKESLGLQRLPSWSDIGLALLAFFPYAILSNVFNQVFILFSPSYDQMQVQELGFSNFTAQHEMILAFLALVVAAPIIEEIIFRGYLFGRLKKHTGTIIAIILTSLTFAVLHMQLNVGIDVFALSVMLCLLRIVTGSIWAGVLLHMIKNGLAYYVLFVMPMIQ